MLKVGVAAVALAVCGLASPAEAGGLTGVEPAGPDVGGERLVVVIQSTPIRRTHGRTAIEAATRLGAAPDERAFTRRLLHPEVTASSLDPALSAEGLPHPTPVGVRD